MKSHFKTPLKRSEESIFHLEDRERTLWVCSSVAEYPGYSQCNSLVTEIKSLSGSKKQNGFSYTSSHSPELDKASRIHLREELANLCMVNVSANFLCSKTIALQCISILALPNTSLTFEFSQANSSQIPKDSIRSKAIAFSSIKTHYREFSIIAHARNQKCQRVFSERNGGTKNWYRLQVMTIKAWSL